MEKKAIKILVALLLAIYLGVIAQGAQLFAADATKSTVYICGDSTVSNYAASSAPQTGWGQVISKYFTSDVLFQNKAVGGLSSKTFITGGYLDKILNAIKANDYLFVQFGHNDATPSRPERYTDPNTTFKEYLRQYIDKAREKKAIPVLITPMARFIYTNGVFQNSFPAYQQAMKEVAAEKNVPCVDLMTASLNYYNSIGYDKVKPFYMISVNRTDTTHFTDKGALQMARLVSEGIAGLDLTISKFVLGTSNPTTKPSSTPTEKPSNTPTTKPTSIIKSVPQDINGDKAINMADVIIIATVFSTVRGDVRYVEAYDLNGDGAINMADIMSISLLLNHTY